MSDMCACIECVRDAEPPFVPDPAVAIALAWGIAERMGAAIEPGRYSGAGQCCPLGAVAVSLGIKATGEEIGNVLGFDCSQRNAFFYGFDGATAYPRWPELFALGRSFRREWESRRC